MNPIQERLSKLNTKTQSRVDHQFKQMEIQASFLFDQIRQNKNQIWQIWQNFHGNIFLFIKQVFKSNNLLTQKFIHFCDLRKNKIILKDLIQVCGEIQNQSFLNKKQLFIANLKDYIISQSQNQTQQKEDDYELKMASQSKKQKLQYKTAFQLQSSTNSTDYSQKMEIQQQKQQINVKKNVPQSFKFNLFIKNAVQTINGNQLLVTIKIIDSLVDIFYTYDKKKQNLRQLLQKYVNKTLSQKIIHVKDRSKTQINILQQAQQQVKNSIDDQQYKFDPFFEAIHFTIKRINGQTFQGDFKVFDNVKIKLQYIQSLQSKKKTKFNQKDDIKQLVKHYICQKKHQSQEQAQKVIQKLKTRGANKIFQLFKFNEANIAQLQHQIRTVWVNQLFEIVSNIKNQNYQQQYVQKNSSNGNQEQKKKLLKKVTAHKIYRFLVYKLYGYKGLHNVPLISYQNMKQSINLISKQIYNEQALKRMQNYLIQFNYPFVNKQKISSRGFIVYGPPGTGKTQITQKIASLAGFHMISPLKSAAEFMKTYVGQSSRMIQRLAKRARFSSFLPCGLLIDQIQSLVPDRKDKEQKNKQEGLSMLLSLIDGCKDIPNLFIFGSTNHIQKIDIAFKRRLSQCIFVSTLDLLGRINILLQFIDDFKQPQNQFLLTYIVKVTINFTGACMKQLASNFIKQMNRKKLQKQKQITLSRQEFLNQVQEVAQKHKIKIGTQTLSTIYSNQQISQKQHYLILKKKFLSQIQNKFILIQSCNKIQFGLYYKKYDRQYFVRESIIIYDQKFKQKTQSLIFFDWVLNLKTTQNLQILHIPPIDDQKVYIDLIQEQFTDRERPTILIIQDFKGKTRRIINQTGIFYKSKINLFIFFFSKIDWVIQSQCMPLVLPPFKGRVLIQLKKQSYMQFQLEQERLLFKKFAKSKNTLQFNKLLPDIIQHFTSQNVGYITCVNYNMFHQNNADNEQKQLKLINHKFHQAQQYKKSVVILNLQSFNLCSQSNSTSNLGGNQNFSINDHKMFTCLRQCIINYARIDSLNKVDRKQKWLVIIVKNQYMIQKIKKQMNWPQSCQQIQKKKLQEKRNQFRSCKRCGVQFTDKQNQEEKKCKQHVGYPFHVKTRQLIKGVSQMQLKRLQASNNEKRQRQNLKQEKLYRYSCCYKHIEDKQGEKSFKHIGYEDDQRQDQLQAQRRNNQWDSEQRAQNF